MKHFAFQDRIWWKRIELCFAFIIMAVICASMAFDYDIFKGETQHAPIFIIILGWIGLLFLVPSLLYALFREVRFRFSGREVIQITDEGLYIASDFVPWERITFIREWNKDILLVGTDDYEERMASAGLLKRLSMKVNDMLAGPTIGIPIMQIDGSADEFVALCMPYLKQAEKKKKIGSHNAKCE